MKTHYAKKGKCLIAVCCPRYSNIFDTFEPTAIMFVGLLSTLYSYLHQRGTVSLVSVPLFVCLFVCPCTRLREKFSSDVHETLQDYRRLTLEKSFKLWGLILVKWPTCNHFAFLVLAPPNEWGIILIHKYLYSIPKKSRFRSPTKGICYASMSLANFDKNK